MPEVSLPRLYALRTMYLILLVLVPQMTAARMVYTARPLTASDGWAFTACLLAALSLLCALGLRSPLKMLPLLLFELAWKVVWLVRVALPLWFGGKVDDALVNNTVATVTVVLVAAAIPWRYVFAQYLTSPGEPWRRLSRIGVEVQA